MTVGRASESFFSYIIVHLGLGYIETFPIFRESCDFSNAASILCDLAFATYQSHCYEQLWYPNGVARGQASQT